MLSKLAITLCLLPTILQLTLADTPPTRPGPYTNCNGIAVSSCPATSGCCFAGACCGSGCCAATEMCIYPNTANAACCRFDDPTLCGSKASSPRPSASDLSNAPVDDPNCTRVRICVVPAGTWTCFLGQPCGFFKGQCGECPALTAGSRPSSVAAPVASSPPVRASSVGVPSSRPTPVASSPAIRPSSANGVSPIATPVGGGSGGTTARSSSDNIASVNPTSSDSSPAAASASSRNDGPPAFVTASGWKAMVALLPAYVLAV